MSLKHEPALIQNGSRVLVEGFIMRTRSALRQAYFSGPGTSLATVWVLPFSSDLATDQKSEARIWPVKDL